MIQMVGLVFFAAFWVAELSAQERDSQPFSKQKINPLDLVKDEEKAVCIDLGYENDVKVLCNKGGDVTGTFESQNKGSEFERLTKSVLRINGSSIEVSRLPSYEWIEDGRLLVLYGSPPGSHRGGGIAVEIVSVVDGRSTGLIQCGSSISSKPVVGSNNDIWLVADYNISKREIQLLHISNTGEVSSRVSVPLIWSPTLKSSPDKTKFLLWGYSSDESSYKIYLFNERGAMTYLNGGLFGINTWVTNNDIFTTDGLLWRVVDVNDASKVLVEGTMSEQRLIVYQYSSLPDGRVIIIGSSTDANPQWFAVVVDWKSGTVNRYSIDCKGFTPSNARQFGLRADGDVWLSSGNKQIFLR